MAEEIGGGNKIILSKIGRGNKIISSKIGRGNELRKFAKIVVAEEIGRGNEIVLSLTGQGNEPRRFAKIMWKKGGKFIAKKLINDLVIKIHVHGSKLMRSNRLPAKICF